jgi:hypothetical protein
MIPMRHAILAALAALCLLAAAGTLSEPVRVRFRLADGVVVTGSLTRWDADGFDGSFGRRQWVELKTEDVWHVHRRVMDQESATDWINLGRVMLLVPDGDKWGERAFRQALRRDASAQEAIDEARAKASEAKRLREAAEKVISAERLESGSPEAEAWRADAWPTLTEEEQRAAVLSMKADAARILERAGMRLEPVETNYFLFYSDMNRAETVKWAAELDNMYRRLLRIFELASGTNIFWGKAVIFVFNDQDRFRLVEAESFGHLVPLSVGGLCHFRGPKVFVSFYRQPDDLSFAAILVHETVHGFMHRYRTPRRLPTWANEGFADFLSAVIFNDSPVDQDRRRRAVEFVRDGGNPDEVLDLSYADSSWPGRDSIGYPVGYLLVWLMIRDRPNRFGAWVNAVKAGRDWQDALAEDFGVSRDHLVETFARYFMVND